MTSAGPVLDRSRELTFPAVNEEAVETLLEDRIVIIQGNLGDTALQGTETAYRASRKHDLPRRIAGRVLAEVGLGHTNLYKKLRVSDITLDLAAPAPHMKAALPAVEAITKLNDRFFSHPRITQRYGNSRLNLAVFGVSRGSDAFAEHQDSLGATGLAYAAQHKPALWSIHRLVSEHPYPPAPVDFTFTTSAGDVVVTMQREGACPEAVPYRQSSNTFVQDASPIHSGINLSEDARYIMGVFNQEVAETI